MKSCLKCPAGEPIGEPSGVFCRIEERPIYRWNDNSSVETFCHGRNDLCPSYRTFQEQQMKQSELARRERFAAELEV